MIERTILPLITNSRAKSYLSCQLQEHIRYDLRYRPIFAGLPLRFGTTVHAGLESWFRGEQTYLDTLTESAVREKLNLWDLIQAQELLSGYNARWREQHPYTTVAVELEFDVPLIHPDTGEESGVWREGGKIDALVRDKSSNLWIFEHKTSAENLEIGSEYWTRLALDSQLSTYTRAISTLYPNDYLAGCVYDVISKVSLKPHSATPMEKRKYLKKTGELYANQRAKDETDPEYRVRIREDILGHLPEYFYRQEVARTDDQVYRSALNTWNLASQMHDRKIADDYLMNPGACRYCDYKNVCYGFASLDDPSLFRQSVEHEELKGEHTNQSN